MEDEHEIFELLGRGDTEGVRRVIAEEPALASSRDPNGVSAVLFALYVRQPALAADLAAHCQSLGLHEAAALGDTAQLKRVLDEGEPMDGFSGDGFTPLHLAAFFDRLEAVELLLAAGAAAGPEARNPMRVRPIHSAVAAGGTEVVRALIDSGAEVDVRQQGGFTPLMGAAKGGHLEMVQALLSAGADPELQADDGRRARDLAAEAGHEEIAALL